MTAISISYSAGPKYCKFICIYSQQLLMFILHQCDTFVQFIDAIVCLIVELKFDPFQHAFVHLNICISDTDVNIIFIVRLQIRIYRFLHTQAVLHYTRYNRYFMKSRSGHVTQSPTGIQVQFTVLKEKGLNIGDHYKKAKRIRVVNMNE